MPPSLPHAGIACMQPDPVRPVPLLLWVPARPAPPALPTFACTFVCRPFYYSSGVALFSDTSRAGLRLFGPGTKPDVETAPDGWRGVFTGGCPHSHVSQQSPTLALLAHPMRWRRSMLTGVPALLCATCMQATSQWGRLCALSGGTTHCPLCSRTWM